MGGVAAHEVGDLEGQHAGEGVDADVVVGPVVHWGEGHQVGVFELAESELGLGLGTVAGDDLGDWPVVAVGDQHSFAEHLLLEHLACGLVELEAQPVLGWGVTGELVAQDPGDPRILDDLCDFGFDRRPGTAGVAAGEGVGQLGELRAGLGQGLGEPAGLRGVQGG